MFCPQNNDVRPRRIKQPAHIFKATENLRTRIKSSTKLKKNPNYKDPCQFNKGKKKLQKRPRNENCSIENYQKPEKFKDEWEESQTMPERQTRFGTIFRAVIPTTQIREVADPFAPLPEDAVNVITAAWTPSPEPRKILFKIQNNEIRNSDLRSLELHQWLSDEIICSYMDLICERNNGDARYQKVFAFNTYFYESLQKNGPKNLQNWTKKIDIFSYGIVFIPIHFRKAHWILASINMPRKSIKLYDSYYLQNETILLNIRNYLSEEFSNKKQQKLNIAEWEIDVVEDRPTQDNNDDCGVFMCQFAEWISRGETPAFTQANIPYYRNRMVYEIMKKKLLL